ncbi:MAG TPA: tRNA (guanosine(46)-N7)-methyltransferase TrmB [Verrucomicrobia bacterium]|nr:tRNA (guanosine(46)-N7)-methyltransferase TrmB [Verrucomicrobiales bacterium]HIL55347.1 tRNA (guanosine(46)-N7)-methyltransferase TrmB [Verrucomicrobiota bacterium]
MTVQFFPSDYFIKLKKEEIFPDPKRPLEIDLGCGDGSFLINLAVNFPSKDFLGVERLLGRVRKVCRRSLKEDLQNLKVLRLESSYTLEWLLPDHCASRIHLLFPDPWPKKKHHKRRLVNEQFCASLVRVLEPNGEFLFKTDYLEYFEESMSVLKSFISLKEIQWDPDSYYPKTDFEKVWTDQGKIIYYARFKPNK